MTLPPLRRASVAGLAALLLLTSALAGAVKIPGTNIDIPIPGTKSSADSSGSMWEWLSCGLGGLGGAAAARQLAKAEAKKKGLSSSQEKTLAQRYLLGLGLAGCAGGKTVAKVVQSKLSERAKQKREETIREAVNEEAAINRSGQPPSGKQYEWEADGASGQVTVSDVTAEADGKVCVLVDESVSVEGESVQPLSKRCNTPPSTDWVVVAA